ncbi:hypothetical protein CASFOL_003786 [Castilleja foliolosa]|uniref:GCK domain-containing protein n=1 Tax=Castilleja foliolosa TaxID=1961234 RepID=A0ABD3EI69_9LAMI
MSGRGGGELESSTASATHVFSKRRSSQFENTRRRRRVWTLLVHEGKETFMEWQKCVDEGEENGEDYVRKLNMNLSKCMKEN